MNTLNIIAAIGSFILSLVSFLLLQYNNNKKLRIEREKALQKEAIEKTKLDSKLAVIEKDMEQLKSDFEKTEIKTLEAITKLSEKMDNIVDNVNKTIIELLTNKK